MLLAKKEVFGGKVALLTICTNAFTRIKANHGPGECTMKHRTILASLITATSFQVATDAAANAGFVLEETIVTAQKKTENLNDVSLSINTFAGDEIRQLGLSQPSDIAKFSPGVYIKPTVGDQSPVITVRGIGFNDFTSIQNPGVGVYVDQVIVPYHSMMSFQLLDLERIEVLKGPQGTLYGRNSTAGAINFVSEKPSQEFSAKARLDYSRWKTTDLELAIGGGLTENLSARLAYAKYDRSDSYQTNRTHPGDDIGEKDRSSYRLSLLWDQDDFNALVNIHGGSDKSGQVALEHLASLDATTFVEPCGPVAAGNRAEGPCVNAGGYFDPDSDPHAGDYSVAGGGVDNEAFGVGITLNWDLSESLTLTSVTGYDKYKRRQLQDIDASPFVFIDVTFTDDTDSFSQELRINSEGEMTDWLVGIFYSDDTVDALQSIDLTDLLGGIADVTNNQDSKSAALFANASHTLTDTLTLLAGIRYTDEEKDWDGGSLATPLAVSNFAELSIDNTDVSGQLGLEYRPNNDWLVFAKIGKGFRSGGFPGGFAPAPAQLQPFDPEEVYSYETGLKATLAEGAVQLNVSLFYYDWKDLQTQFTEERSGLIALFLTNAGDADIIGAELNFDWAATEGLTLHAGLGVLDTEISSDDARLDGKQLANAPELTYNLKADYVLSKQGYETKFTLSSSYTDERFFTTDNTPVFRGDDYTLIDARIGVSPAEGRWSLALWGRNLADEEYRTEGFNQFGFSGDSYHAYGEPRSFGISLGYDL